MGSWELASAHLMQENEWLRLYKQKNDKPFFIKGRAMEVNQIIIWIPNQFEDNAYPQ